jgi:cellulose synthase/poly-beta-1,6-N-acetylglucosamine synthase-like glycosyltransferase
MIFVFYLLAGALIFLSWKSFSGGIAYLRFFRGEIGRARSGFAPPATVFIPCRGLDDELRENLTPHLNQDYPDYEVIFVVDSRTDEATPVIGTLIDGTRARLVIAGPTDGESQKVHNLRQAVTEASAKSEVFVFADSDVRPASDWLRTLVAPLEDATVGCATGYRWFISKRLRFASEMRSVWNASIASALGPNTHGNFCWGGSTAVRRETFEAIGMRERWRGTLSDDFAMTRAMRDVNLAIAFVPKALSASLETCGWHELFEFTTRQMKITRVYAPRLWKLSFIGSALFTTVITWALLIVVTTRFATLGNSIALVTILAVSILSIGKALIRLQAVGLVLTEHRPALRRQLFSQCTLWLLSPLLFLYNCCSALVSRRIAWRGIEYEMRSPTETIVTGKDLHLT